jgi:hypothetical protein
MRLRQTKQARDLGREKRFRQKTEIQAEETGTRFRQRKQSRRFRQRNQRFRQKNRAKD